MDCRLQGNDDGECKLSDGALEYFSEVNNGLLLGVSKLSKQGGRNWIGEGICQGSRCDDGCIDGGFFWHWVLVWKELHCFGGAIVSGLWNIESVAAIVFRGGT